MAFTYGDVPAEGCTQQPIGEVLMLPPALGSNMELLLPLTTLPWHNRHKITIAQMHNEDGTPWVHCPVNLLKRTLKRCEDRNLQVLAGFEMEFVVYSFDDSQATQNFCFPNRAVADRIPFGGTAYYASHQQMDMGAKFLDDVVDTLGEMEIDVRMMHPECAFGQYEIVLVHSDVETAVRKLVIAREAVRAVARKHNLGITFSPVGLQGAGSGAHVHLSLANHFNTDDQLYGEHIGIDQTGQAFIAGIYNALQWLPFFTNANPISYNRIQPRCWVGAYHIWGLNNKEAPIRISGDRTNFEFKLLDAVSNPYIAMAAIVAAGLDGIDKNMELPPPMQVDPASLPAPQRPSRLPKTLCSQIETVMAQKGTGSNFDQLFHDEMLHDYIKVATQQEQVQKACPSKFHHTILNHF